MTRMTARAAARWLPSALLALLALAACSVDVGAPPLAAGEDIAGSAATESGQGEGDAQPSVEPEADSPSPEPEPEPEPDGTSKLDAADGADGGPEGVDVDPDAADGGPEGVDGNPDGGPEGVDGSPDGGPEGVDVDPDAADGGDGDLVPPGSDDQIVPLGFGPGDSHREGAVGMGADGSVAVVWVTESISAGGGQDVYLRLFDPTGLPSSAEVSVIGDTDGVEDLPDVTVQVDGSVVVAWQTGAGEERKVHHRRFSAGGEALDPAPLDLDSTDSFTQAAPRLTRLGEAGGYAAAWERKSASVGRVYYRHFSLDGTPISAAASVDGSNSDDQVLEGMGIIGPGPALSWTRMTDGDGAVSMGRAYDPFGNALLDAVQVKSSAAGDQYGVGIFAPGPQMTFQFAWIESGSATLRSFTTAGAGGQSQVVADGVSDDPADVVGVALGGPNLTTVYASPGAQASKRLHLQKVAGPSLVGSELPVATTDVDGQWHPDADFIDAGEIGPGQFGPSAFAVVWTQLLDAESGQTTVLLRRFDDGSDPVEWGTSLVQ